MSKSRRSKTLSTLQMSSYVGGVGAAILAFSIAIPTAFADGLESDYGAPGPYTGEPDYLTGQNPGTGEATFYQPPPDGVCYDEDNQTYECATDADYASYSDIDDGYDPEAYQNFQEALSPYGSWVNTPQYGNVWYPSSSVVGYDFMPYYTGGHWVLTDYGWTWVSDWDWGWAPFHYGRWVTLANYGWCWVPGRIWGPAWVHFRHGGGYVGWAPLPPRGVRIPPPLGHRAGRWAFVAAPQMGMPRMARVHAPGVFGRTMAGNVFRSINNTRVNIGPPPVSLSLSNIPLSPLRGLTQALPRQQVVYRPGVPLVQRPYLPAVQRNLRPQSPLPTWQRPTWPATRPSYQQPTYQQPSWQRPSYQAPSAPPSPPVWQRPSYQAPAVQRPSAPYWERPSDQAPTAPTWQRPQAPSAPPSPPVWQRPSYQAPAAPSAPPSPPVWQRPSYQAPAAPSAPPSPPVWQRPSYQAPAAPSAPPSPPVWQRPSYQAPTPAPSFQRPSYQAPTPAPSFQRPSYQAPSPSAPPAPSVNVVRPAPSFRVR